MKRIRKIWVTNVYAVLALLMTITVMSVTFLTYSAKAADYNSVIDSANLLSSEQTSDVKYAFESLEYYQVALYIENSDLETVSDEYIESVAETLYSSVFGKSVPTGILIAFSFYEGDDGATYYYYQVYSSSDVSKTIIQKLAKLISESYDSYSTDADWVAGSINECVEYLQEQEYNIVHADELEETRSKNLSKIIGIIFIVIVVIFIIALLVSHFALSKELKEISEKFKNLQNEHLELQKRLSNETKNRKSEFNRADEEIQKLQAWKKNAIEAHPEIEQDIANMLAKKVAKKFDDQYSKFLTMEPSASNYYQFAEAVDEYNKLSETEKNFVTIDVKALVEKRDAAAKAYATEAELKIQKDFDSYSDSYINYDYLDDSVAYYNALPDPVQMLITASLVNNLRAKRERARQDRIRHQSSMEPRHSQSSGGYGGGSHSSSGYSSGGSGGGSHNSSSSSSRSGSGHSSSSSSRSGGGHSSSSSSRSGGGHSSSGSSRSGGGHSSSSRSGGSHSAGGHGGGRHR